MMGVFICLFVCFLYWKSFAIVLKYCLIFAAAERREMRRKEEKLLEAAREGDISTLTDMVSI